MNDDAAAEPTWLGLARGELGVAEAPAAADNARVLAYYRDAGHAQVAHDSVAWCAAFACAMLERARVRSPRTLAARGFLAWGVRLDAPRPGCLAVLWRNDPKSAEGHVGFYLDQTTDHVRLLGGNQGDSVSVAWFPSDRILGLRWPADGVPAKAADANACDIFALALRHVLTQEGGWTEDPFDPGGPTNFGITLAEFAEWRHVVLTALTLSGLKQALRDIPAQTVETIYRERYWQAGACAQLPAALAFMHFDAAVNHGTGRAARFLQTALGVAADGEIGPLTLAAAQTCDLSAVLSRYAHNRRGAYRALPQFWRFGRGWLSRVDATLTAARALAAAPTPVQQKETKPMPADNQNQSTSSEPKWWGHSMTIWGVMVTTLSSVLPVIAQGFGLDLPADLIRDLGSQTLNLLQAASGVAGVVMTILGRLRATQPLERRAISLKL